MRSTSPASAARPWAARAAGAGQIWHSPEDPTEAGPRRRWRRSSRRCGRRAKPPEARRRGSGMPAQLRAAVYAALNPTEHSPPAARLIKGLLLLAIAGSVVAATWSTMPGLSAATLRRLGSVSVASFTVFALEYALRLLSASGRDPDAETHPLGVTFEYVSSPLGVVDGLVVLPQLGHALGAFGSGAAQLAAV